LAVILRYRSPAGVLGVMVDSSEGWSGQLTEQFNLPDVLEVTGATDLLRTFAQPGASVTLEGPDTSGPWLGFYTKIEKTGQDTSTVTWTSFDLWMWGRIIYPVPASAWTAQTASAYYSVNTNAEAAIIDLVNKNLGPGALTARRLSGLTMPTSLGRGSTRKRSYRFNNLGESVAELGELSGLRTRIVANGANLILEVTAPGDLSATAKYGTPDVGGPGVIAQDWSLRYERPESTHVLAAAGGVGVARIGREGSNVSAQTLWGRIESFIDQRQTTDSFEIDDAIMDALADVITLVEVSATIPDDPALRLGADVPIGAKVGLDLDGDFIVERLRRVETSFAAEATTRQGFVGSPNAGVTRTQQQIRSIQAALRRGQP
jgi:hypothetical protein